MGVTPYWTRHMKINVGDLISFLGGNNLRYLGMIVSYDFIENDIFYTVDWLTDECGFLNRFIEKDIKSLRNNYLNYRKRVLL